MTLQQVYDWLNGLDKKFQQLQHAIHPLMRLRRMLLSALIYSLIFACLLLPLLLLSNAFEIRFVLLVLSVIGLGASANSLGNLARYKKLSNHGEGLVQGLEQSLQEGVSKGGLNTETQDIRKRKAAAYTLIEQLRKAIVLPYYYGPLDPLQLFHKRFGKAQTTLTLYLIENWLFLAIILLSLIQQVAGFSFEQQLFLKI